MDELAKQFFKAQTGLDFDFVQDHHVTEIGLSFEEAYKENIKYAKAAASLCREKTKDKDETLRKIRWELSARETFDVISENIVKLLDQAGFHHEPKDY